MREPNTVVVARWQERRYVMQRGGLVKGIYRKFPVHSMLSSAFAARESHIFCRRRPSKDAAPEVKQSFCDAS